jgi:hypothetical protein
MREEHLMHVFDNTTALDQAVKERIRHRIWARVISATEPSSSSNAEAYISLSVLLGGLSTGIVLGVLWSGGYGWRARVGAAVIAILSSIGLLLASSWILTSINERFNRAFNERFTRASQLGVVAVAVLTFRSVPLVHSLIPAWTIGGLRAGLVGLIVVEIGLLILWLARPIFTWMEDPRRWTKQPEANIVINLLVLLADLKALDDLRQKRDQVILATMASRNRRGQSIQQVTDDGARKVHTSELTDFEDLRTGSPLETLKLDSQRNEGWRETVLHKESSMLPDMFQDDPEWQLRKRGCVTYVEIIARHIERGLPSRLKVGDARLDAWLKQELHARAQTVRNWAQLVAFPSQSSYDDLLIQVGTTLEHAAEDQWAAIPSYKSSEPEKWGSLILRFSRHAGVGIVPLLAVFCASKLGFPLPPAVRDSLLTFAIPWILLQIIELLVPNASDYLSRSKSLRELLPLRRSDKE